MIKPFYRRMLQEGHTPKELAKAVGVSHQTIYSWKLGKTKPRIHHLKRISRFLGIPYHALLDEFY
jgi:transcriptional regulator with XRE-family HTH domain